MKRITRSIALAALGVLALGVDGCELFPAGNPDGGPDEGGEQPKEGTVSIYLTGDMAPIEYGDDLAGQTPYDFHIGLSTYYAMTAADDPAPALCFDHGDEPAEADLSRDNLVGHCETASIPSGVYTHGRVKVEWARFTVDGSLHLDGEVVPGRFSLLRAYSDTVFDGVEYGANTGTVVFETGPFGEGTSHAYPPPESMDGVATELVDGELWMTFEYTNPLPVDETNRGTHWARFHWKIHEAFRWVDTELTGYEAGTWDVGVDPEATEEVLLPGVAGYHTTSSID